MVRCFRKNTPKNQPELNGIEAIYVVVVVVFIFTLSFLNYSPFYFSYFISFYFFYPRILEVGKCVPCVQVATPLHAKKSLRSFTKSSN